MIRMLGIIENQPLGVTKATWDTLKTDFQKKLGLGEASSKEEMQKKIRDQEQKIKDLETLKRDVATQNSSNYYSSKILSAKAKLDQMKKSKVLQGEGMDPVGSEDGDIDNDGDSDSSDDYLANRRKKIGKAMKKESLQQLVKEEYVKIQKEAMESAPKIEKKLKECREKMVVDFFKRENVGTTKEAVLEKRIQVNTVAEMIDVPVNELILYFLNNVKTMNERQLIEYRLGHVYFYAS